MRTHFILDSQKDELAQVNFKRFYFKIAPLLTKDPNTYLKVKNHPYLELIHSKYPFFNSEISLFLIKGHGTMANEWPIHIDAGRRSALNIPILNCDIQSTTYFYDQPSPFKNRLEPMPQYQISIIHGDLALIDKFNLTNPTIINTSIPHSVVNNGSGQRVIMSWGSMLSLDDLMIELISKRQAQVI